MYVGAMRVCVHDEVRAHIYICALGPRHVHICISVYPRDLDMCVCVCVCVCVCLYIHMYIFICIHIYVWPGRVGLQEALHHSVRARRASATQETPVCLAERAPDTSEHSKETYSLNGIEASKETCHRGKRDLLQRQQGAEWASDEALRYVCVCVYTYIHTYIHIYICMYIYTSICIHIHVCVCVCECVCVCV